MTDTEKTSPFALTLAERRASKPLLKYGQEKYFQEDGLKEIRLEMHGNAKPDEGWVVYESSIANYESHFKRALETGPYKTFAAFLRSRQHPVVVDLMASTHALATLFRSCPDVLDKLGIAVGLWDLRDFSVVHHPYAHREASTTLKYDLDQKTRRRDRELNIHMLGLDGKDAGLPVTEPQLTGATQEEFETYMAALDRRYKDNYGIPGDTDLRIGQSGDLRFGRTLRKLETLLDNRPIDLVLECGAGGLNNVPRHPIFTARVLSCLWQHLHPDGGRMLLDAGNDHQIRYDFQTWIKNVRSLGINVTHYPPQNFSSNHIIEVVKTPNDPIDIPSSVVPKPNGT